jgi:hypothetical protein
VGVEPTILAAKDRINGFEGHEDHRTSFASNTVYDYRDAAERVQLFGVIEANFFRARSSSFESVHTS